MIRLTDFQLLTPGLYTGDKIRIRVNYRVECEGWVCYLGWSTRIEGKLNGQTLRPEVDSHIGGFGGKDNVGLEFTGLMPHGDLEGEIIFLGMTTWPPPKEIARRKITIVNLDDLPPNGDDEEPPIVCTEGTVRCRAETHDSEICRSNKWILHKRNVVACGYIPPPTPPFPSTDWFERYKWWILGISIAILVATILLVRGK